MIWPFKKKKKFPLQPNENGMYPQLSDDKGRALCPNCGGDNWIEGPEGGASVNVQCRQCLKYYNWMGPFGFQDIGDRSDVFGIKPTKNNAQVSN